MGKHVCRAPFVYDADLVSNETGLKCEDESLAVQSDKDDADINVLVKRFGVTGQMPVNMRPPILEDFNGIYDYKTAMDAIAKAEEAFLEMPAEVRQRFDHDPDRFVRFCSDVNNIDEMRKMGLAVPAPAPDPAPAAPDVPVPPPAA